MCVRVRARERERERPFELFNRDQLHIMFGTVARISGYRREKRDRNGGGRGEEGTETFVDPKKDCTCAQLLLTII